MRAGRGACERAAREAGERLDSADERDARRVVRVTVAVRVDGTLEAGDHLVGARGDRAAARSSSRSAPTTRIGRMRAPRARRRRCPAGPRAPATMPASCVPCRRRSSAGRSLATASCRPARRCPSGPRRRRARRRCPARGRARYGCTRSTSVSSSATVTPLPSKPGSDTSTRRPSPGAKGWRPKTPSRRAGRVGRPHRIDARDLRARARAARRRAGRARPRSR